MKRKILIFLILMISVLSISCISATDMKDTDGLCSTDISDGHMSAEISLSSSDEGDYEDICLDGKTKDIDVEDDFIANDYGNCSIDPNINTDSNNNSEIEIIGPKIVVIPENESENVNRTPKIGPYEPSNSTDIPVISINTPGTFADLQDLINNAKEGSTIKLYNDYVGSENAKVILMKNIIIDGLGHTIDCMKAKNCIGFVSLCGNITLKNLIIKNGYNYDGCKGGAICNLGPAVFTLINCQFIDNWADDYGGAIYNEGTLPWIIKNCIFRGNTASDDDGGAIFSKAALYVEDSIFENNWADDYGGAIYIDNKMTSKFNNCTFKSNIAADNDGGGIYSKGGLEIDSCDFSSNTAYVSGGAVKSVMDVHISNSHMSSNNASGARFEDCNGGAIWSKETVYIQNCTISCNNAGDYGGGIYAKNVYLKDSLMFGNHALDNSGGAIYADNLVNLIDSDLWSNSAYVDGGGVYCNDAIVNNCEFNSNKANPCKKSVITFSSGGAIYVRGTAHLYSSKFYYNTSSFTSPAIHGNYIEEDDGNIFEGNK